MKIQMRTRAASAAFTAHPGEIIDRPESEAKQLIASGHAMAVTESSPETTSAPAAPESATSAPAPETAAVTAPETADKPGRKSVKKA